MAVLDLEPAELPGPAAVLAEPPAPGKPADLPAPGTPAGPPAPAAVPVLAEPPAPGTPAGLPASVAVLAEQPPFADQEQSVEQPATAGQAAGSAELAEPAAVAPTVLGSKQSASPNFGQCSQAGQLVVRDQLEPQLGLQCSHHILL